MNGYENDCYGSAESCMNRGYVGTNYAGLANSNTSRAAGDAEESPIERQLDSLERRIESVIQLLGALTERAAPVLRADTPPKEAPTIREAGQSPLHERLVSLNSKASDVARFVDHTIARFTI